MRVYHPRPAQFDVRYRTCLTPAGWAARRAAERGFVGLLTGPYVRDLVRDGAVVLGGPGCHLGFPVVPAAPPGSVYILNLVGLGVT